MMRGAKSDDGYDAVAMFNNSGDIMPYTFRVVVAVWAASVVKVSLGDPPGI